jgi:lipopolysaccharide transport system ATP-binding protein
VTRGPIVAESLGKRYQLGRRDRYQTLRDVVAEAFTNSIRRTRLIGQSARGQRSSSETEPPTVWALRNVSFALEQGEVLGVIGRNGSGKSTLLKILSRITEPTEGWARLHGRVGSLLEVGTGFHQELTGRENIYLNGAILGMRRAEINRNFDEIVAFAETERFLDTPVKHYSSGMYMRLAFAVAAHLQTEILLIDEVLAVGDVAFQKRCLGKIGNLARDGRTVLFVSHDLEAVQRLCTRCILLDHGTVVEQGATPAIVAKYLSTVAVQGRPNEWLDLHQVDRIGNGTVRFLAVKYGSTDPTLGYQPYTRGPLEFTFSLRAESACEVGGLAVTICDQLGTRLLNADLETLDRVLSLRSGLYQFQLRIEELLLNPGVYRLNFWLADRGNGRYRDGVYDFLESACEIEVFGSRSNRIEVRYEAPVVCDFSISEVNSPGPVEPPTSSSR